MNRSAFTGRLLSGFISLFVFVLLPFIFSFRLQDIEQSPRFVVLSAAVCLGLLYTLFVLIRHHATIRFDRLWIFLLLFLLLHYAGLLKSISTWDALYECLKLTMFVSLFMLFTISLSGDANNRFIFLKGLVISALIFIAIGLDQMWEPGIDSLKKGNLNFVDYSITSTLGNKNFFAEALLLMLPLIVAGFIFHNGIWKIIFGITMLLIPVLVLILQTLSTWFALAVMMMVVIVVLFSYRNKLFTPLQVRRMAIGLLGGGGLFVIVATMVVLRSQEQGSILKRLTTVQQTFQSNNVGVSDSVPHNSTFERLYLWKTSLKIIGEHPVTGTGTGNWKLVAPSYGLETVRYMATGAVRFVHPHNDFLLYASELGIAGALIFAAFIFVLISSAVRMLRTQVNSKEFVFALLMLSGVTGYIMIALVSLPSSRIFPLILLMLYAAFISSAKFATATLPFRKNGLWISLAGLFLIAGIASVYTGFIRMQGDFNLSAALLQDRKKNYSSMQRYLQRIDTKIFPMDATATPVKWYQGFAAFYLGEREKAFELFREAEKENPNHLNVLNDLGTAYNLSGDPVTAEKYYKKALSIQPAYGDAIMNLSIIYFNAGKTEEAYQTLIRYTSTVKRESVNVFKTIITSKAAMITNDEKILTRFAERFKNTGTIKNLLDEIRKQNGRIEPLLK